MSEQDFEVKQALAETALRKAKEFYEATLDQARLLASELEALARLLRSGTPTNIDIASCESVVSLERLRAAISDISLAAAELADAREKAINLGVPVR